MSRVAIIDPASATGEVARYFEATAEFRGRVPNSSLVWGHIPYIAKFQLLAGAGDVFEALRRHLDEAAIVELTALCTVSTKMDRIHNALRLPLEGAVEFAALHRSGRIDPERLRNYLRAVVDAWPQSLH